MCDDLCIHWWDNVCLMCTPETFYYKWIVACYIICLSLPSQTVYRLYSTWACMPSKKSVIGSGMAWNQASGSWAICDSGAPCAANSCCNLLFSSSMKTGNGSFEKKRSHMYISTWTTGERNLKGYPCAKCFALGMGLQKMLDLQIITDQSFMNHLQ